MIMKLFLITLLIVNIAALVALGFIMFCRIYNWKHKNDPPTKEEWKLM